MQANSSAPRVAIACGGTGGHLFPGVAVAEELKRRGCAVTLLISPKEVDQKAVQGASGVQVATLPAVGLTRGKIFAFARGFGQSYRAAKKLFANERPDAVLAMGGFTSAPPVLAGKSLGVPTFLHESNTIPGRANRWLSWTVSEAFVGFSEAGLRLHTRNVKVTGTPVRLDRHKPVLLVTGGSQGASGLNDLVIAALPFLAKQSAGWQLFHLTGTSDVKKVEQACASYQIRAVVKPFFGQMNLALGATTVAISRAGASSLAELAAMRVPSVLVPFPAATDNHQYYNASAFEKTGAAVLIEQRGASPGLLASKISELAEKTASREQMRAALAHWHVPQAAERIAESIMQAIAARRNAGERVTAAAATNLKNQQTAIT
jgi:UDP-N-acetylglucosamine--N-acetylmuramyl-(pentapeptide) pyrophosphoryl-undecaprenol N-acetylglucosamine transferase